MTAFYNEHEPYAAAWLRNLSEAGHIANGTIDSRSIVDVQPADLEGVTQAHFFAGIGVWSHALRLAGWADGTPVWTGSCPCQPFSGAGKGEGFSDPRHLWPEWFRLIRECHPLVVFGEQVASPDGLKWLDAVSADMEGAGYSFGAADLCAAGVGAPHIRQRLYFVAYASGERRVQGRAGETSSTGSPARVEPQRLRDAGELGDPCGARSGRDAGGVLGPEGQSDSEGGAARGVADESLAPGAVGELGHASNKGLEGRGAGVRVGPGDAGGGGGEVSPCRPGVLGGPWADAEWLPCRDGKFRPVRPGSFPLAHGAASRVGRLRAYGNAIVAEVAATFIRAASDSAAWTRGEG